jgi:CHRD domain
MRKRRHLFAVFAVVSLLVVGATATSAMPDRRGGPVVFTTRMDGGQEVPGPGDPDGMGVARISLYQDLDIACWKIRVINIELPGTAAHIHIGDFGMSGGIVVTLAAPDPTGLSQGCTSADPATIDAIVADPSGYYVNAHNIPYPAGAIRGQLG